MKKTKILILLCVIALQISLFFYWQTNRIVVNIQPIKDNGLASFFDGLRVVQISDLHINRFGSREEELVHLIEKIDPNLILITGDFLSRNSDLEPAVEVVGRITKNRNAIAILGNADHEFRDKKVDTAKLVDSLRKKGVTVLVNRSIKLKSKADSIFVIGLDDNYLWKDDFFAATANLPLSGTKILLAHSPDIVTKVNLEGINLVLSGHTHGGQVKLPFVGAIHTNRVCNSVFKFVNGLYRYQNSNLYVNRGIGTSFFPLRFLSRPEVTIFKFEKE